ncbi:hypothetical protein [Dankookia sp. P2]|uniref:hypothetical protein n=1 Tax=Dankookia sp. P2 TaxID=3423955 RepID=UPI003D66AC05
MTGQLRDAVEARQRIASERAANSRASPSARTGWYQCRHPLLRLGPEHPESRA